MERNSFDQFLELVDLDALLMRLKHELVSIQEEYISLLTAIEATKKELSQAQLAVADVRKKVHALDLELRTLDTQEKEKRQKLAHAATPKEYFSLEGEVQALEKKRKGYEEPYLSLWQQLESEQEKLLTLEQQIPLKVQHMQHELDELEKRKTYVEQRIESLHNERQAVVSLVSQELLEEYTAMLARIPNPVVPIIKSSCSACFYLISPHKIIEAKQDKLIKCQDCFRLLYFPRSPA